jgi:hypothetical protein
MLYSIVGLLAHCGDLSARMYIPAPVFLRCVNRVLIDQVLVGILSSRRHPRRGADLLQNRAYGSVHGSS